MWDHRNRLTQVVPKNSGGAVLYAIDYEYDVFDRRVARVSTPAVGAAISQHFVCDGDHIALQFDGGTLTHRYLYGPVVDQILTDEQVGTGEVLWPLTDNLGSVRDIATYDSGTDTTAIVNHIVYDAFGRVVSETNSAVDLLFGYTGRDWDAQAELQYNRARWYDPKTGQWLSEDPIGFEAGDANVRRYVGNGVTTRIDPSGLWGEPLFTDDERNELNRFLNEANNGNLSHARCTDAFPPNYRGRQPATPEELDQIAAIGDGAVTVAGVFVEPVDTAVTLVEIYKDPWDPWNYVSLLPFVPVAVVKGIKKLPTAGADAARTGKGPFGYPSGSSIEGPIQSIEQRAADLVARNGGRPRVSIKTPSGRINIDLQGKSHGGVSTPHVEEFRDNIIPSGPRAGEVGNRSPIGPVREATHDDLRIVDRILRKRGS